MKTSLLVVTGDVGSVDQHDRWSNQLDLCSTKLSDRCASWVGAKRGNYHFFMVTDG
jgi:hypothetical protein